VAQPYPRVYLASRSARRRELLKQIGIGFEVILFRDQQGRGPDIDETPHPGEKPEDYVLRVCREKADFGWNRLLQRGLPRLPVLSADTTVCIDDTILGKPSDREQAAAMLRSLAGREHRVLTAVAVRLADWFDMAVNETFVRFRDLDEREITDYADSGEPLDKAGAYAIQGRAAVFITEIRGSYSGVVGLPLCETAQLLRKLMRRE